MNILIEKIRIKNYKSIEDIIINLSEKTMLIGKNNSGKTSILEAISLAFNYADISKEVVFATNSSPYSIDKKVIIDVLVKPYRNMIIKDFDENWSRMLGSTINYNLNDYGYFAYRTEISYDVYKEKYINNKNVINNWDDDFSNCSTAKKLSGEILDAVNAIFINAHRDISSDIMDRKSLWSKLTSNINIRAESRNKLESQLKKINKEIVKESQLLKEIVKELSKSTDDDFSKVEIDPITRDIDSIYKGMNIFYSDNDCIPTSIGNLGLGVRSWASFSVIKASVDSESKRRNDIDDIFHPFILVEEPEAHLHPQAQKSLFKYINSINAQKIVTTHSPYVITQSDLTDITYVRKKNGVTNISKIDLSELSKDEVQMILQKVINTRGDLLFSNAIILAEGETEEQCLPIYYNKRFAHDAFCDGIDIISVGGSGSYAPFIRLATAANIKVYIFSDGEKKPLENLAKAIKKGYNDNTKDYRTMDNVFIIPNEGCYESYLVNEKYTKTIISAINEYFDGSIRVSTTFNNYIQRNNGQKSRGGIIRDYKGPEGLKRAVTDFLISDKTLCSTIIAKKIVQLKGTKSIPVIIKKMLDKIYTDLLIKENEI